MNSNLPTTRVFGIYRGAIIDGSRGFQPTGIDDPNLFRRGATADLVTSRGVIHGFMYAFAMTYPETTIVKQAVSQLPWRHSTSFSATCRYFRAISQTLVKIYGFNHMETRPQSGLNHG
jgi:hypothetical protein